MEQLSSGYFRSLSIETGCAHQEDAFMFEASLAAASLSLWLTSNVKANIERLSSHAKKQTIRVEPSSWCSRHSCIKYSKHNLTFFKKH
jgi:hypothetical protein